MVIKQIIGPTKGEVAAAAAKVAAYWERRGAHVSVWIVETLASKTPTVHCHLYGIRSDLVNGLPIAWDDNLSRGEIMRRLGRRRSPGEVRTPAAA